jgi:hypothetical protein
MPCPQFSFEPGALQYQYQNGSEVFIGAPQVTCTWPRVNDDVAALIWASFNSLVTTGTPDPLEDGSISVTLPDFSAGGLRTVKAYMTRPSGKAVGDGTQNMSVTFYNLHATSMASAFNSPMGNDWEAINGNQQIVVGASEYPGSGWQY